MIHDKLFDVSLEQIAVNLLPTRWRRPIHIALAKLIAYPFTLQLNRLREERARNIYIMTHDSRVGKVEKMLNDNFDLVERRIKLGDGNRVSPTYIYTEKEAKQTYLPKYIYTQDEILSRNIDFTVLVPTALNLPEQDLQKLKYLTKYYTGKDKNFKIELI